MPSWGLEMLEPRVLLSGDLLALDGVGPTQPLDALVADPSSTIDASSYTTTAQTANATPSFTIGESGSVAARQNDADQWHQVTLSRTYDDPVVVMGPLSREGGDPVTVRVRNVTPTGFQWQIDEWDYLDQKHTKETIGYLVIESGSHTLEDGTVIVAGTTSADHQSRSVDLPSFSSTPVVLAQVTSVNEPLPVVTRVKNVTGDGFQVYLQEDERHDNVHLEESISYIALEPSTGSTHGLAFEAAATAQSITNQTASISFATDFANSPVFLANMQTANGDDPASIRYRSLDSSGVSFFLDEERSADQEKAHTAESVGYLAIDAGPIKATTDPIFNGVVLDLGGDLLLSGSRDDYVEVSHDASLALSQATVSLSFVAQEVELRRALFSKDAQGQDHGGHLTVFIDDGRIQARMQGQDQGQKWLSTPQDLIEVGVEYHVAVTFGPDGFWLYVDGQMMDWSLGFQQGWETNPEPLAIGANIWGRSPQDPNYAFHEFEGVIRDFTIYDSQFTSTQIAQLAGVGPPPALSEPTVNDQAVLVGTLGDDAALEASGYGVNAVFGDAGDDVLIANDQAGVLDVPSPSETLDLSGFANVLDGGEGRDVLEGSDLADLLISRSDAREPKIAQPWDAGDDPLGELDAASNTHYSGQPIEGDDVLIGGGGADVFYFQTRINAKRRIILKHVNSDGTIHWGMGGVAGENDYVHDHWVEALGDELIADFDRDEGDHILIEGHTTEVYDVQYLDSDGDQNLDTTVLHLWSRQPNGGAHDGDLLGTITVPGTLLTASDYTVHKRDYGVIETISDLDAALAPYGGEPDDGQGPAIGSVDDGPAIAGVALRAGGDLLLSGSRDDYVEVPHDESLALSEATISLSFVAQEVELRRALFSKDAQGQDHGGHLTVFIDDGRIQARMQGQDQGQKWLSTPQDLIEVGVEYHVAVTFGPDGFWLYVDGQMMDWSLGFQQGWETNPEPLAIGANIWGRSPQDPNYAFHEFEGVIRDFTIYDSQFTSTQIAQLAGVGPPPALSEPTVNDQAVLVGTLGDDAALEASGYGVNAVFGDAGDDVLIANDQAGVLDVPSPSETLDLSGFANVLDGGEGRDVLEGSDLADLLISRSDAREPKIAQPWDAGDDPLGELDAASNTHYSGQPIEGDDVLIGGGGADVFYFQTRINAKRRIILKHVNSDGTIHWGMGGVAGENDYVHDHWVEALGDELIADFDRDEGDHILIEGHTTEVYDVQYLDSDGDQNLDTTVLHLWSRQPNGGAHDGDLLGTITVPGTLLTASDYTVHKRDYGVIETISDLDAALAPYGGEPDDGQGPAIGSVDDGPAIAGVALRAGGDLLLSGSRDDYVEVSHDASLALSQATVSLSFVAQEVELRRALFSKDAQGQDHGGHLTVFIDDGRIQARMQGQDQGQKWLSTPQDLIEVGVEYHVAVTFGPDGFWLYVDGQMMDWSLGFQQGWETNPEPLAIGANIWGRSPQDPNYAFHEFEGVIRDFTIYDSQFTSTQIAQLAGVGPPPALSEPTVNDQAVLVGTLGDDAALEASGYGVNAVFGDAGDDVLIANDQAGVLDVPSPSETLDLSGFANVLDGGEGRDVLEGSDLADLLISRSDAREPKIAQPWDAGDDPLGELDAASNTHYSGQPIEGDDVLIGGGGADVFYFQTRINAKRRIILKHVNSDGTIHWGMGGVAGENDYVHDHWVEALGDELIADFDRDEGDHILIEGHTTEVYDVQYLDSDGDQNLDTTVLHLWSRQPNGGAHDGDLLGTITVPGTLLTASDYTVHKRDYGVIETISDLDAALAPYGGEPDDGQGPAIGSVDDGPAIAGVALRAGGDLLLSGSRDDYVEVPHDESLALSEATISLSFVAQEVELRRALFSKDAQGQDHGGHLTVFIDDGRIQARMQGQDQGQKWLSTPQDLIEVGVEYHVAVTFGPDGFWLYVDGQMMDWSLGFQQGWETNPEPLAIGANIWGRSPQDPNYAFHEFEGVIRDFTIYDSQFTSTQIAQLAGVGPPPALSEPTVNDQAVLVGTLGDDAALEASGYGVNAVFGDAGDDVLIANDQAGVLDVPSPSETLDLSGFANVLDGGEGRDVLEGSDLADLLISRSDAREPKIAQPWDAGDDPLGELDAASNTHYSGQPIEGDDVLIGGGGADVFYFQTRINAKRRIILKHVNSDGTIHWGMGGVAGENDYVHDHWVEALGDELIADFDRDEGDHILIEGHTTEVYDVQYLDSDGDQNLDTTVLHLWSRQPNGGAHDGDLLGTITVPGTLLTASDYTVHKRDYGVIETISDLDAALAPYGGEPDDGQGPAIGSVDDGPAIAGVALRAGGDLLLSGSRDDYVEVSHDASLALSQATVSLSFVAQEVELRRALFSKDAQGQDHGGHLTVFIDDGRIQARMQGQDQGQKWLSTPQDLIEVGVEYHVAVTFGPDGFWLYVDGQMMDWSLGFQQGWETNPEPLAIGANIWGRSPQDPNYAFHEFEGVIRDFTIYDSQFTSTQIAQLAGVGPPPALSEPTVNDQAVLVGTLGDDAALEASGYGVNAVFGDAGDDVLIANDQAGVLDVPSPSETLDLSGFANVLDGGEGRDVLEGSDLADLLISRSDAREPKIAQPWDAGDDPLGELDAASNTHYSGQPIEGDDVLIGGGGADVFYFQTRINAKRRIILKHVNSDGTIHWGMGGVAGENDYVHDHWVEALGDELIADFDRDEGDHILIEGHTTEVYDVQYLDSDGDQNLDTTVLHLWSRQPNGGAHDGDLLGTITVPGTLLTASDYTVHKRDYGVIETISDLDAALAPYGGEPDDGQGPAIGSVDDGPAIAGVALRAGGDLLLSGSRDDYVEVPHDESLALSQATISLSFVAQEVELRRALFSKDAQGQDHGGHLTVFIDDGRIQARMQGQDQGQKWLSTPQDLIEVGVEYHVAVTFGPDGFWLYVDGQMMDWSLGFQQGWETNPEPLAIGANIWGRSPQDPNYAFHEFEGVIRDFTIYDSQFTSTQIAQLAGV